MEQIHEALESDRRFLVAILDFVEETEKSKKNYQANMHITYLEII